MSIEPTRGSLGNAIFLELVRRRVVLILIVAVLVSTIAVPGFFEVRTLSLGIDRITTMGLLAVGLTVILIAGQLDLSGGAVLALSSIAAVGLQPQFGQIGAALIGLLVGLVAGTINGFLVVVLRINSLVATLATMVFFRALAHLVTNSKPVSGIDPFFGAFISTPILGTITFRSAVLFILLILLQIWLVRTVPGRNLMAVGSSEPAAAAAGIKTRAYLYGVFVFGGLMAGTAGVVFGLASNTGSPVFGDTIVLVAISAVVIGGTRLEGGVGSAFGTLGGLLTLACLTTAMEYQGVPVYIQDIVTGVVLLVLVVLDRVASSKPPSDVSLRSIFKRIRQSETDTTQKTVDAK